MHGWRGKLLRVNLSTGEITTDPLDPQVAKDYIGGRGLGIYLMKSLMDDVTFDIQPGMKTEVKMIKYFSAAER